MAGSKRERRPGVWELRVHAGGRRYVSRTHRGDERSADVALARLVVDVADGNHRRPGPTAEPDDPTLLEWMTGWIDRQAPDWSPTSEATARSHLEHHIARSRLAAMPLSTIRRRDIELWLHDLRDKGLAPSTRIRIFGVVRSALEQAETWELIARNPAAKADLPRVPYVERATPTPEHLVEVLRAAPTEGARMLLWLAAATGGRRGQLVALRWSDFELDDGDPCVTFHRAAVKAPGGLAVKDPKSGRPIRLAIDEFTVDAVRTYRRRRQETALAAGIGRLAASSYLFPGDPAGTRCWYPDSASQIWARIRDERVRLPDGRRGALVRPQLAGLRLHDLRHAHATLLIAAGIDPKTVSTRIGHSRTAITMDRYAHRVTDEDRRAAAIIGQLLAPGA